MNPRRLQLTEAEVAAAAEYIFWHVRATEGTARKVYEKMRAFLEGDGDGQGELFAMNEPHGRGAAGNAAKRVAGSAQR